METPITEEQIKSIGFKKVKSYDHDEFNTNRYKRKNLEVLCRDCHSKKDKLNIQFHAKQ